MKLSDQRLELLPQARSALFLTAPISNIQGSGNRPARHREPARSDGRVRPRAPGSLQVTQSERFKMLIYEFMYQKCSKPFTLTMALSRT
jgi:hypothetical protein